MFAHGEHWELLNNKIREYLIKRHPKSTLQSHLCLHILTLSIFYYRNNRNFKLDEGSRPHLLNSSVLLHGPLAYHSFGLYLRHRCTFHDYEPQGKPSSFARIQEDEMVKCLLYHIHVRLFHRSLCHFNQKYHRRIRDDADHLERVYLHRLDAHGLCHLLP